MGGKYLNVKLCNTDRDSDRQQQHRSQSTHRREESNGRHVASNRNISPEKTTQSNGSRPKNVNYSKNIEIDDGFTKVNVIKPPNTLDVKSNYCPTVGTSVSGGVGKNLSIGRGMLLRLATTVIKEVEKPKKKEPLNLNL